MANTLNDVLAIDGVIAAFRWGPPDVENMRKPEVRETAGNFPEKGMEMAMVFLELHDMASEAHAMLWDDYVGGVYRMFPTEGVAIKGPNYSVASSSNRVGVFLRNDAKPDLWALHEAMMAVDNS